MDTIHAIFEADHRRCDDCFAAAEKAVHAGDWPAAAREFAAFDQAIRKHFQIEEEQLFPAFEQRIGHAMGPTQVMRHEHAQMRESLLALAEAIAAHDGEDYAGQAETLLILMQQHNLKEENVLYPMCDQALANGQGGLADAFRAALAGPAA